MPYLLKVQARPPRDQRSVLRSRVSGQEDVKHSGGWGWGETYQHAISTEGSSTPTTRPKTGSRCRRMPNTRCPTVLYTTKFAIPTYLII